MVSDREILGLIGILNIQHSFHLVVVTECGEVCRVKESLSSGKDKKPAIIFELLEVDLIPMDKNMSADKIEKMSPIVDKIKKYLRKGFYFAHNLELTLNAQKRAKCDEFAQEGEQRQSHIGEKRNMDTRYMWNFNLCKDFKAQKIATYWFIKLIQGYVDY